MSDCESEALGSASAYYRVGFPGGLGAESLVEYALKNYGVVLTVAEAVELKKIWMAAFPEMQQYFDLERDDRSSAAAVRIKARELGVDLGDSCSARDLENALVFRAESEARELVAKGHPDAARALLEKAAERAREETRGLQRYVCRTFTGRVAASKTFNSCANMHFQGPGADVAMKNALFGQWLRGYRIVAAVHDEVIAELRLCRTLAEDAAEQAAAWVADGRELMKHVTLRAEPALMLRWDKGAEAVYDAAGRLLIWTPDIAFDEPEKVEAMLAADRSLVPMFKADGATPVGCRPRATEDMLNRLCDVE